VFLRPWAPAGAQSITKRAMPATHCANWKPPRQLKLLPLFCADQGQHGRRSLSRRVFIQHLVQQSLDVISPFSCDDTNNACKAFPPDRSQLQTSNSPWLSSPLDPISTFSSASTGFHGKGQHGSGSPFLCHAMCCSTVLACFSSWLHV